MISPASIAARSQSLSWPSQPQLFRRLPSQPRRWTSSGLLRGAPNPTSSAIGTGISIAGSAAALAVPIVGPIAAGIGLIISALGIGGGCGQTCVQSSNAVQQWAPAVTQLGQLWQQTMQQQGGCITSAQQQQFLSGFDQLWQWLVQQCTAVGGQGGRQCIADRQRGGKADVFAQWRDPIANSPICNSPATASQSVTPVSSNAIAQGSWTPLLIPAALIAAALVMQ